MTEELQYILVVVGLFLVPRVLQRFRIPSAITCVLLGAAVHMGFDLFHDDGTVGLLSTFGIVALFLCAGLEVDFEDLRRGRRVVSQHLLLQLLVLAGAAPILAAIFGLEARPSILLALALLTPSTGFILDSLGAFGLDKEQRFWVKTKAIASEMLALLILFVTVQSSSAGGLVLSLAALIAMVFILPPLFHVFARVILPYAPKSEFTFLVIVALACAFVTRELGVYYLVGAFVVGVTALRLRKRVPELASERILGSVEFFAAFFIPFYFFKAGLHLEQGDFTPLAIAIGVGFLVTIVPLRLARVTLHRRVSLDEPAGRGLRVSLSLVPTLVFTIVIADILRARYAIGAEIYGGLIVFALVNTMLPGLILKAPPPEFDAPDIHPEPPGEPTG